MLHWGHWGNGAWIGSLKQRLVSPIPNGHYTNCDSCIGLVHLAWWHMLLCSTLLDLCHQQWTIAILEGRLAKGSSGLRLGLRHSLCPNAKGRWADVSFSDRPAMELIPYFNLEAVDADCRPMAPHLVPPLLLVYLVPTQFIMLIYTNLLKYANYPIKHAQ